MEEFFPTMSYVVFLVAIRIKTIRVGSYSIFLDMQNCKKALRIRYESNLNGDVFLDTVPKSPLTAGLYTR